MLYCLTRYEKDFFLSIYLKSDHLTNDKDCGYLDSIYVLTQPTS